FVRGPFGVEGLILGMMGALVAFLIQWAVYGAVCRAIIGSGALTLFTLVEFKTIWQWVMGVFLAAGAAIGAVGSGFAIRRFLQV
ncbi:MAG: ABC transporter permease, partial [Oscillospiraceae bacterium]|nr:ABC transporter permease [Oscillospiraceae bacterium]